MAGWVATALLVGVFVGVGRTVGEHFTSVVATPTRGGAAAFPPSATPTVAFPDSMVSTATDVATAHLVVTATPVPATPTPVPTVAPTPVTLPVHLLVTSCALAGCSFAYPSSVAVQVPPAYAGALGAYGAAGIVVVGPAGWTGVGSVGVQGNTFVSLYPVGSSRTRGPRVEVTTESTGAAMLNAASYFEQARLDEQHEGNPVPPPPAGMTETFIDPELVAYRLPNTPDGLGIDGVAYFTDKVPGTIFKQEEVVLPLGERRLSTVILDAFIARSILNPTGLNNEAKAAQSANATVVKMTDQNTFDPGTVTISKGQTVTWQNASSTVHSATFDPSKVANKADVSLPDGVQPFDSGLLQPGQSWSHTFTVAGTYKYVCIPHESLGMRGTVVVVGE
ncbi:MAG TPA: plastocyanin/azurin family copper-binding protein [Chloroflexota bacterium]|nr:plastocyanin/azurin family copper-binding protein [Chloroflexota bacterium]